MVWIKGLSCLVAATLAGAVAAAATDQDDLKVVVTVKPIHSLVAALMQDIGTPTLLVDGAASAHSFALKPSGVRAINAADVFIRVSEALEPFTGKILTALPDRVRVVTLAEAPGLELRERRTSGSFEPPAHGGDAGDDHEERYDRTGTDGHIWLDPDNAKAIVAHLAQVLSERAPAHAPRLRANAEALNARIDALTTGIETETKPLRNKPFVVFHDAYQYFDRRFGLDAIGAITVSPEVQPSAKRLTELRRKIRALKAVCVFAEPLFQPNLVRAVTEGTQARSGTLDPEGITLEPGTDLYFALMRNLTAGLKSCLDPSS